MRGAGPVEISGAIYTTTQSATSNLYYYGSGTMTLSGTGGMQSSANQILALTVATGAAPSSTLGTEGDSTLLIKGNYTMGGNASSAVNLTVRGGAGGGGTTRGSLSMVDGTANTLNITNSVTAGATVLTMAGAAGSSSILNLEVGNTADKIALGNTGKASVVSRK